MSLERRLGLKDDESLLAVVRASAFTRIIPTIIVAVLLFAPFFLLVPLLRLGTLGGIIIGVSWFLGLVIGTRGHLKWRRSLLAVTEKRLILVRQGGFLDRHVTEVPHGRVQEAAYRVKGLLATLFRYGDLIVEPAGSAEPIIIRRVPDPARIQDLIAGYQREGSEMSDDFGEILDSVSSMDVRHLGLLKAEVDRTLRMLPAFDEENDAGEL